MTAPPPAVSAFTRQLYDSLPEVYRVADASPGAGIDYPLLRFLSLVGDQAGAVVDLIERCDYVGPGEGGPVDAVSALVDPDTADVSWLPWLGQLVGVPLTGGETEADARAAVKSSGSGWKAGTKDSIAAATRPMLSGSQYVTVLDHRNGAAAGTMWDITVLTRTTETPSSSAVIAAINAAGVVPAGCVLHVGNTAAAWDTLESRYATSDAWDATGSWDVIESTV